MKLIEKVKIGFMDAILKNDSIEALCEAAYELLNWPMIVGRDTGDVLLMLPNEPIGLKRYDELQKSRKVPMEIFIGHQKKIGRGFEYYEDISFIEEKGTKYPLEITMIVSSKNDMFCQIVFHVDKEVVTDEEMDVLRLLKIMINREYFRDSSGETSSYKQAKLRLRMLADGNQSSEMLSGCATELKHILRGGYMLAVSYFEYENQLEYVRPIYNELLNRLYKNAISIQMDDYMLTLFGEVGEHYNGLDNDELRTFIAKNHIYIAKTSCFYENLQCVAVKYQQAILAARLGKLLHLKDRVISSEKYMPMHVFVPLVEQYDARVFLHPIILDMIRYDQENGSEFVKTLRTYLVTNRNSKESSRLLSIHQNTLTYRLSRIKDIFGVDFENGRLVLTLLISVLLVQIIYPERIPLLEIEEI